MKTELQTKEQAVVLRYVSNASRKVTLPKNVPTTKVVTRIDSKEDRQTGSRTETETVIKTEMLEVSDMMVAISLILSMVEASSFLREDKTISTRVMCKSKSLSSRMVVDSEMVTETKVDLADKIKIEEVREREVLTIPHQDHLRECRGSEVCQVRSPLLAQRQLLLT